MIARGDSFGYRSRKFIRRNKSLVSAAALVALTLVGGIIATTREAQIARVERQRAERRFNDVRKLANSFMFEVHDAIQNLPGSTRPREILVTRALQYLDSLAQEAGGDASLRQELAIAYQKVGDVQGNPYFPNLGDRAGALASYRKSMAIRQQLYQVNPADLQLRRDLAVSHSRMAEVLRASGDLAEALANSRRNLDLCEQVSAQNPENEAVNPLFPPDFVVSRCRFHGSKACGRELRKGNPQCVEEPDRAPGDGSCTSWITRT